VLFIPDKLGRRWSLFISALLCVVGGGLQAGSVHIAMFMVARLLVGCGAGTLSASIRPREGNHVSLADEDV
jgi:MFS family permease